MSLLNYVQLYRAVGKPTIQNGLFAGEIEFNPDNIKLVQSLWKQSNNAFDELIFDGKEFLEKDNWPKIGKKIEFVVRIPADSADTFHSTISKFIQQTPKLSRGEMPTDFYVISEDYYSGDGIPFEPVEKLAAICLFIQKLSELAHYYDLRSSNGNLKLVFVQPNDTESASPVEIVTKIEEKFLDYDPPDICLIDELCRENLQTDPHFNAKKGVFGVTLADFMKKRSPGYSDFEYLIQNWRDFILQYQKNLATYLSGFAFHKAKREVAEAEFHIAEQFSKIISEIAGKLLSIPISFALVIAIAKSNAALESMLLFAGLLIAAIIVDRAVNNQQMQLQRVSHAKNVLFNSLEGRKDTYPEELRDAVSTMISNLNKNEDKLEKSLVLYRILTWMPTIISILILLYNYYTPAKN